MGKRKVLLSCFFDISRAYDQVWHARLLQKLQKIGLSGKIFNYIKTFLTGRSLQVRWKGAMSAAKQIDMGVPEGSVIAPLPFNIIVHDVESCVQGKVVLTMYADDLAIWLDTHVRRPHKENNRNMAISMKTFQEAVDGVIRFMQVNGFTLSTQKTVFLPFHICSRRIQDISIKVNNDRPSQVLRGRLSTYGAYQPPRGSQRPQRLPRLECNQGVQHTALGEPT